MAPGGIGLVLGAGGSVGLAYHGGVLAALEEATGWDPRRASLVVGTSAGSLTGAFLRSGMSAADLCAITENTALSPAGAALADVGQPHRPRFRPADFLRPRPPGDLRAGLSGLVRPWRSPMASLAALLPEGPVSTEAISAGLDRAAGPAWPADPLWICAVGLGHGRRTVFGRDHVPEATVGTAVAASCAIPGVYRPVRIGAERYVDGGVASIHNLDLVGRSGPVPDLVVVSAPMAYDGRVPLLAADVAVRQAVRAQLALEVAALRRRGIPVVTVAPDRRTVLAMGVDAMDARRRASVSRVARRRTLERLERSGAAARIAAASSPTGRRVA